MSMIGWLTQKGRIVAVCAGLAVAGYAWAQIPVKGSDVRGGWQAELYSLKDGTQYPVRGQILFTEKDWTVLFFVMKDGKMQRGSGEGGSYKLDGSNIVLTHKYWVIPPFPELPSLKAQSNHTMVVPEDDPKRNEPATITIDGNRLTLNFGPSGNHMSFIRSSGP